ncbi:hypothetical protein [Myxosarcina sp. GI1(2024)]
MALGLVAAITLRVSPEAIALREVCRSRTELYKQLYYIGYMLDFSRSSWYFRIPVTFNQQPGLKFWLKTGFFL